MYEVGIKKKNAFINYINALHFFKRKIGGGGALKFVFFFFFFFKPKIQEGAGVFERSRSCPPGNSARYII